MQGDLFLLAPVLFPVLAGIAVYFLKIGNKTQNLITGGTLAGTLLLAAGTFARAGSSLTLWRLTEKIDITLRPDDTGRIFLLLVAFIWMAVGIYSFEYTAQDSERKRFYLFFLITLGVLSALCMAGSIISFYLFYELMTLATLPLVMHTGTKEAVSAGIKYLLYSVFGASAALLGIFIIGTYGTTYNFIPGGVLDTARVAGNEGLLLAVLFVMLTGFGMKAGMFPLHSWLPAAHPVAPAPASAVLSGIITKAGVLGAIRAIYFVAGADFLRGTWVQYSFMALTLVTVLLGSVLALREQQLKRRLAYSTVSQVSYILFGLSTLTTLGFIGAMLHVVFHALIKNTLFMGAGAIIQKTGKKYANELSGIGKRLQTTMWCFTVVSIGLVGIPPTGGFISKWNLAQGALSLPTAASWLGPVILLVSALLTASYLFTIVIRAFFPGRGFTECLDGCEVSPVMTVPMAVFAAASVLLGMFPQGMISMFERIAAGILHP